MKTKTIRTILRMRSVFLICAIVAFLVGGSGKAQALTIHQSVENFWDNGSTQVIDLLGVFDPFWIGPSTTEPPNTIIWQLTEKVQWLDLLTGDPALDTTLFSYTVFNDSWPDPITSFHIDNDGIQADSWTAPTGWSFGQDSTAYWWTKDDPTTGGISAPLGSLNEMLVWIPGLWTVTFSSTSFDWYDSVAGETVIVSGTNWKGSHPAIPEPTTLSLLGIGLVGLVAKARRRLRI